jgi:addiction module HigA family antidote
MTKRDFPPIHPGEILLEDFLKPMQISQYHLAQAIGVPPRRINEIVHGKRGITADTAIRLERLFGMPADFWLRVQSGHDDSKARAENDCSAIEPIDTAPNDYGMPMGPVELADTVGLDVCLSVARILGKEFGMPVPKRLEQMVDSGKLGRKTGEGFYHYEDGKPVKDRSRATGVTDELTDRLILPMINEAAACLREKIVEDDEILDGGVIFGTGFAPFRGGPVNYARSEGVDAVRERLSRLQEKYGDRFRPDAGWADIK